MANSEVVRLQVTITPNLRELDYGLKAVVDRSRASANAVVSNLNAAFEKADREAGRSIGSLTDKMRNLGIGMTVGITAPLMMAGKAAVDNAVKMQRLGYAIDAVTPSAAAARQEMEQLREVAKLPGLGYKEAIQLAVGLQATGVAAEEAQRFMKAFGNAIATVGGGKEEIAAVGRQLMQMSGKAHPMMQDIRIIQEYVPQMLQAMKKIYGTTDTEAISKMGISSKQFLRDIVTELEKLPRFTGGIANDLENISDQWFRFSASIGERALPALSSLLKSGADAMETFSALPTPIQNVALGLGVAAAAAGPLVVATALLIRSKATLTETIAALNAGRAAEAAWVARMTGLQNAEVVSTGRLAAAKARFAGAGASLLATLNANRYLIAGAAVASLTLNYIAHAKAVRDSVNALRGYEEQQSKSMQKAAAANEARNIDRYSQLPTTEINARISTLRGRASEALRKYEENERASGLFQPLPKGEGTFYWGSRSRFADAAKRYKDEYQQAIAAIDQLKQAKDKQSETVGGLSNEAKEALAKNEEANRLAKQDMWVLSQASETARKRAEAWADYVNTEKKITDNAAKVQKETGVVLNVADQIAAARMAYKAKVKEINDAAIAAAVDEANTVQVAKMSLNALQATNEYESQRLQVQAELVDKLHDLQKSKASEVQVRLAHAEAAKQIAEINKREARELASEQLAEAGASALADAIRSGDERAIADTEATISFYETYQSLYEKGANAAQRVRLALERWHAARRENEKRAQEEADRKRREAYETSFGHWRGNMEARAAAAEDMGALTGDEYSGAAQAMAIRKQISDAEIAGKQALAKTEEERAALKVQAYANEVSYQRQLLDLENKRSQAVLDRAKAMQAEEKQLQDEIRQRQMQEMMERRAAVGYVSAEEAGRRATVSGFRARFSGMVPMQPGERPVNNFFDRAAAAIDAERTELAALLKEISMKLGGRSYAPEGRF